MNKKTSFILFLVIVLATFSRLFISIPNFTAIGSLALFCGAIFNKNKFSVLLPFIALLVGDLLMALTGNLIYTNYFLDGYFIYVYVAFGLTWLLGKTLLANKSMKRVIGVSLLSSFAFYLITNFGSWLQIDFYTKDLAGLGQAYLAGLVFYKNDILSNFFLNQVVGDLAFAFAFFGMYFISVKQSKALEATSI
jgi:hypothetical protein